MKYGMTVVDRQAATLLIERVVKNNELLC